LSQAQTLFIMLINNRNIRQTVKITNESRDSWNSCI